MPVTQHQHLLHPSKLHCNKSDCTATNLTSCCGHAWIPLSEHQLLLRRSAWHCDVSNSFCCITQNCIAMGRPNPACAVTDHTPSCKDAWIPLSEHQLFRHHSAGYHSLFARHCGVNKLFLLHHSARANPDCGATSSYIQLRARMDTTL